MALLGMSVRYKLRWNQLCYEMVFLSFCFVRIVRAGPMIIKPYIQVYQFDLLIQPFLKIARNLRLQPTTT